VANATYKIGGKLWLYSGDKAAWHFLTLPKKESATIKKKFGDTLKKGWGSVPVTVKIGKTTWNTSIFPDKSRGAYLLPVKSTVRKKERLESGKAIDYSVSITTKVCSRGHLFSGGGSCYLCWPSSPKKGAGRKTDHQGIKIIKYGKK